MVQDYHTILSEHFVKAISDCNEAMCWSAVLCPLEASKQSLPILVVEMNGKFAEKQIHSAFEDMRGRSHFDQKIKGPKSRHYHKVLPR